MHPSEFPNTCSLQGIKHAKRLQKHQNSATILRDKVAKKKVAPFPFLWPSQHEIQNPPQRISIKAELFKYLFSFKFKFTSAETVYCYRYLCKHLWWGFQCSCCCLHLTLQQYQKHQRQLPSPEQKLCGRMTLAAHIWAEIHHPKQKTKTYKQVNRQHSYASSFILRKGI